MATTVSLTGANINNPAPQWFTKTKSAVSILSNTAVIILLAAGIAKDNALLILILRTGISGVFDALNGVLGTDTTDQTKP